MKEMAEDVYVPENKGADRQQMAEQLQDKFGYA